MAGSLVQLTDGVAGRGQQQAGQACNRAKQRVLDAQVASTDGMTGKKFEQLVARLFERNGYTNVRIPGGSGDLEADVMATAPDGTVVVVQCKRYSEKARVSSPDMQKFLGTCFTEHNADYAWFVTTTRFSMPARDLGTRRGVTLVDGSALAEWMARGAGVTAPTTITPGPDLMRLRQRSERPSPAETNRTY